ncbi:MAG: GxxExxY protein [Flavobacteriales bacterium]|nr:GxxExxY protein [Flavobacteriales bacterium]MCB9448465.1 GxxExxY protein [Flavobacteriales bacterium]
MYKTKKQLDALTYEILGCAIEVHKHLGPGLLESVYERCFIHELRIRGLKASAQQRVPVNYKGLSLEAQLRYDVLVEDMIVVELKAIEEILPVHQAVLLTYMKLLKKPKGIIINFNCSNIFKEGQKTMVNDLYANLEKI